MAEEIKILAYASEEVSPFNRKGLETLVRSCAAFNERLSVTGTLVYTDGIFFQILEGEPETIETVMKRIRTDPRHKNIEVVLEARRTDRLFPTWTMGFCDATVRPPVKRSIQSIQQKTLTTPMLEKEISRLVIYLKTFYVGRTELSA